MRVLRLFTTLPSAMYVYLFISLAEGMAKKSPNFIFATKMVFPKSLKFMNSGSELCNCVACTPPNKTLPRAAALLALWGKDGSQSSQGPLQLVSSAPRYSACSRRFPSFSRSSSVYPFACGRNSAVMILLLTEWDKKPQKWQGSLGHPKTPL